MCNPITSPHIQPIDPHDEVSWGRIRSHFMLEPGHSYLNNASLGMPPEPVAEVVAQGFRHLFRNPTSAKRKYHAYINKTLRPAFAAFIGADPEEIAFTRNATESLYDIANGIPLKPGDEVLTTTQEHPEAIKPWQVRAERSEIVVKQVFIPSPFKSADQIIELLQREITDHTRVLCFCHVTRGGYLYPVRRLCALARKSGILSAVDGAQAVGMMDINLHNLGCDIYANSLHKWFLGPSGTGFLYVRREVRDTFHSLYASDNDDMPEANRYEMPGTYDLPVHAAIGTALDFLNRIGIRNIEIRLRMLSDYLKTELQRIPQVRLHSTTTHDLSSPGSTIFEIDDVALSSWVSIFLEESRIHVDDHDRDGHDAMRISTHYYNTTDEIDCFIVKLKELIGRYG